MTIYSNIASSIRVQRYESYDEATDTYTGLMPDEAGLCFHELETENHSVDYFYYMDRGQGNPAVTDNHVGAENDVFASFVKEETDDVVNILNVNAGNEIWEAKTVKEDGVDVRIPWLKRDDAGN